MRRLALVVVVLAAALAFVLWRSRVREERATVLEATPPAEREAAPVELAAPEVFAASSAVDAAAADETSTATRSPVASEPSTRTRAAPRTRIRGQVVDAQTGAPLVAPFPLGLEFTDGSRAPLGEDGSFELSTDLGKAIGARVVEEQCGARFEHRLHRYSAEATADGAWRLPLDVVWMAELEIVAPRRIGPDSVSLSLIESVAGVERTWASPYFVCRAPDLALVRKVSFESAPSRRWLEVRARDADDEKDPSGWEGRVEAPLRNGVQPLPIRVELHESTFARGVVLDEDGAPWCQAEVELCPLFSAGTRVSFDRTGEDGVFRFAGVVPGEYHLYVSACFVGRRDERVVIRTGRNDLGSFVLPRGVSRGTVSGKLVAVGDDGHAPTAALVLRDRRTGDEFGALALGLELFGKSRETGFEFRNVPDGPCELEFFGLDGRVYPTEPLEIEAPVEGLVIEAHPSELATCRLEVRDARSREALAHPSVLEFVHGRWLPGDEDSRPPGPAIVVAAEHAPRRIDSLAAFVHEDQDGCRCDVALEPGWGRAVLTLDVSDASPMQALLTGPPLSDVRVLAGGRELARSDAAGLALLALAEEPPSLEFVRRGYRVVDSQIEGVAQFVLMERE